MKLKTLLVAMIVVISFSQSNAQNWKKMVKKTTKKVVNKTEEKAENKVENAILNKLDEAIEKNTKKEKTVSTEKQDNSKNNETTEEYEYEGGGESTENSNEDAEAFNNLLGNLTGNTEKIKTETNYSFDAFIAYKITTIDEEQNKSEGFFNSYFNAGNKNSAMIIQDNETGESTTFISDEKNKAMLMLNAKKTGNSGFVMPIKEDETVEEMDENDSFNEENQDEELEEYNIQYKKTGKTKTILGYLCEEYVANDENATVTTWTTRKLKFSSAKGLKSLSQMNNFYTGGAYPSGFVMELTSKSKKDKTSVHMIVTDINESTSKNISTEGYQLINMNF